MEKFFHVTMIKKLLCLNPIPSNLILDSLSYVVVSSLSPAYIHKKRLHCGCIFPPSDDAQRKDMALLKPFKCYFPNLNFDSLHFKLKNCRYLF